MSVRLRQIRSKAVIAVGSNLGDRSATFGAAVRTLAETVGIEVTAISTPIETVAVRANGEDPDAPTYLNGVALVNTTLAPRALLAVLHVIEQDYGRVRTEPWGDRTLDLDLIDYAGMQSSADDLTLPHPRAFERLFVLRPWLEVDPDAILVGHGRVADLVAALESPESRTSP